MKISFESRKLIKKLLILFTVANSRVHDFFNFCHASVRENITSGKSTLKLANSPSFTVIRLQPAKI